MFCKSQRFRYDLISFDSCKQQQLLSSPLILFHPFRSQRKCADSWGPPSNLAKIRRVQVNVMMIPDMKGINENIEDNGKMTTGKSHVSIALHDTFMTFSADFFWFHNGCSWMKTCAILAKLCIEILEITIPWESSLSNRSKRVNNFASTISWNSTIVYFHLFVRFVPAQRWLHNIEHGAIVMLYHPCTHHTLVEKLRGLVKGCIR